MITPQAAELVAADRIATDRIAERQQAAATARPAALARCCQPGTWVRVGQCVGAAVSQVRDAVGRGRPTPACCAGA